jgi:hypothetical protein
MSMGLDIIAISKTRLVKCLNDDEECLETHFSVGTYRKRRDGVRAGCYVVGKGGRSYGFTAGSYFGYGEWKRQLSLLALGAEPEEVWANPRRFRAKPFVELIDFTDSVGPIIGPKTSAKLYADFVAFASTAKKHYRNSPVQAAARRSKRGSKPKRHLNEAGLASAEMVSKAVAGRIAKQHADANMMWMWDIYRDFRRAFKLASNRGFVLFT